MNVVALTNLIDRADAHAVAYQEVLRVPALSAGLYRLPAASVDPQQPHTEDEVYYVIQGRGSIRIADEDRAVEAGSLIYVAAGVPHHFHNITDELAVLVLFAPAEYTAAPGPDAHAPT